MTSTSDATLAGRLLELIATYKSAKQAFADLSDCVSGSKWSAACFARDDAEHEMLLLSEQAAARIEALSKENAKLGLPYISTVTDESLVATAKAYGEEILSLRAQLDAMGRRAAGAERVIADAASQRLTDEMDEDEHESADFEGAYDIFIKRARAFQKDTTHDQG